MAEVPVKISQKLMDLLCCPACKDNGGLSYNESQTALVCGNCQRTYEVKQFAGDQGQGISLPDLILVDS